MSAGARGPAALPPPVIYLAALLLGLGLNQAWPVALLSPRLAYVLGTLVVIVSCVILVPVLMRFKQAGTPLDVRKPATALVTDGPFRYSRNPGYVSLTLLYLGVALLLNNLWVLVLAAPAFLVLDLWIVRSEERHLEARFGEQYVRYKQAVRRWL